MSLSAWEQQALDSIKDGLAGSDPELAALLSAFTGLASGEDMPDRERVRAGSRPALRRLRRARWRSSVHRMCQRLGIQRAALLLWLLTTAALIAVALALNAGRRSRHMHRNSADGLRRPGSRTQPGLPLAQHDHRPGAPATSSPHPAG